WKNMRTHLMTSSTHCQKSGKSMVLAVMLQKMYEIRSGNAILSGCSLLLQLWSYERLAVGRPFVSHEPYHGGMYGDEEDERPTMGTIWIWRQVHSQQI